MIDATDFLRDYRTKGTCAEPRFQSLEIVVWTKEQPDITGDGYGCEFHHVVYRSEGNLASDIWGVPATPRRHAEYHAIGKEAFEAKYKVNMAFCAVQNLQRFLAEHGLASPYKAVNRKVNQGNAKPKKSTRKNREKRPPYEKPWMKEIDQ